MFALAHIPSPYREWILSYPCTNNGYGLCAEASHAMVARFPELLLKRGYYICPIWGEREHWWCETSDHIIIDPTVGQFPSKGLGVYRELLPGDPIPTGTCANCGGTIYDNFNDTVCSDNCFKLFTDSLTKGLA